MHLSVKIYHISYLIDSGDTRGILILLLPRRLGSKLLISNYISAWVENWAVLKTHIVALHVSS